MPVHVDLNTGSDQETQPTTNMEFLWISSTSFS